MHDQAELRSRQREIGPAKGQGQLRPEAETRQESPEAGAMVTAGAVADRDRAGTRGEQAVLIQPLLHGVRPLEQQPNRHKDEHDGEADQHSDGERETYCHRLPAFLL